MLDPDERDADGIACIRGERLAHLREVQAFVVGDRLRIGEMNGALGSGEIIAMDEDRLLIRIIALNAAPPPALPCALVIALPRPKMLKRILVDATSLGVKHICFINAYRVEKSFWSSPMLAPAALAEKCRFGLEQAIDTVLPDITLHPRFRPFVEDTLPGVIRDSLALVAHPAGDIECPRNVTQPTTLVIGPEGGFIPFEIELLRTAGCTPVTLGSRILRVDTVVPTLLGRLFA